MGDPFERRESVEDNVSEWSATKASRVVGGLLRIGWSVKRTRGSHRTLERSGFPDYVFAFHDSEEIGPRMLAQSRRKPG